jgi:hypothetical protein
LFLDRLFEWSDHCTPVAARQRVVITPSASASRLAFPPSRVVTDRVDVDRIAIAVHAELAGIPLIPQITAIQRGWRD